MRFNEIEPTRFDSTTTRHKPYSLSATFGTLPKSTYAVSSKVVLESYPLLTLSDFGSIGDFNLDGAVLTPFIKVGPVIEFAGGSNVASAGLNPFMQAGPVIEDAGKHLSDVPLYAGTTFTGTSWAEVESPQTYVLSLSQDSSFIMSQESYMPSTTSLPQTYVLSLSQDSSFIISQESYMPSTPKPILLGLESEKSANQIPFLKILKIS